MSDIKKLKQDLNDKGMVKFEDETDTQVWINVYSKCVAAALSYGRDGGWSRASATNCANYAVLALRKGEGL
jgi:hypothetical protein